MEIFSHRGIGEEGGENTLSAFAAAVAKNVNIEVDIGVTGDGELVAMHDSAIDRTTNGTGALNQLSFNEVLLLQAGRTRKGIERVPRAEKIVKKFGTKVDVIYDLKSPGIGEQMVRLVLAHYALHRSRFNSENLTILQEIKAVAPEARVGFVTENISPTQIPELASAGIDYLSPWAQIAPDLIPVCHEYGLEVFPWFRGTESWSWSMGRTINQIAKAGASGIIVNHINRTQTTLRKLTNYPPETPYLQAA